MQGNQLERTNWQELLGIYSGFLQEATNYDGSVQNFNPTDLKGLNGEHHNWDAVAAEKRQILNQNVGSYVQAYNNDSEAWNNNPLAELLGISSAAYANGTQNRSIHVRNRPTISNSYARGESNCMESRPASSILANQNCTLGSNQTIHGFNLPQLPTDGFPIPYGRNYNLNSPPRSEADAASSGANSFQFAPVTPDQGKQLQNHLSQMLNFLIDDRSSQETDKQEHLAISIRSEDVDNRCDELLQNIVDSSSASISTTLKEKKISDEGDDRGIDLNKTPEQKTPKRRKHRPKVVTEEKPKRTRKPAAPKNSTPNENPSAKRKYVRKKDLKTSETQQANVVNEVTDHTVGSAAKSCRRALNFDLENATRDESQDRTGSHQAEKHQESQRPFNLNLDSQDTAEVNLDSQDTANPNPNRNHSTNQMPSGCILLQEQCSPTTPPAKVRDHTLNVIARNVSMRRNRHIHGEDISQIPLQADTTCTNLGKARQLILQSTAQLVAKDMSSSDGKRGFKRGYCHNTEQIHPFTPNLDSPIYNSDSNKFGPVSSETHKKMKTGNGFHETIFSMPSCITAVKDCSRQVETGGTGGVYTNGTTSQINGRLLNSYLEKESTSKKLINAVSGTAHDLGIHPMLASKHNFQKQQVSSEVQYPTQQTTGKRSQGVIQVQDLNSLTAMNNWNHMSTTPPKEASTSQNLETCFANMSAKKQPVEPTLSNQGGTDKVLQQQPKDASDSYKKSSMKARKEASTSHFLEACFANLSTKKQPVEPTLSNQGGTDKVLQQQHKSDGYKKSSTKAQKEGSISPFLETCFANLSAKKQPVEPTLSNQGGTDKVLQQQPKDASDGYKKSSTKARKEASTSHFLEACFANLSAKKQPVEPTLSNQGGTDKVLQQPKDASDGYKKSSTKARGMEKQKFPVSVDEITYQLKGLHINGLTNEHALVPYQGSSTIVPYEGFDPIKKRKSRPKVDLDPETDRIWKLLMGKEGSEGTEATNKDKEKWWEDEREVFRGRADSFIARMHLVQGDRRFSRWKGSVVDSVIGVFLTQNVSDHLSSSAFMSLAAKFPLRSTTINQTCYQNGTTVLVEEPDIQILETDGSIKCREKIGRQLVYNRSPITSCESTELRIDTLSSGTRNAANEYNRTAEEEINSSYNYSHFFNFQTSGENRSISVSNTEAQDRTTRYKPNKNQSPTPINLLQTENAITFKGFYSQANRSLLDERFTKGHQQSENPEFNRQKPRLGRADNLKGSSAFTSPINSNILHSRDSIVSPSSFQLNMTPDSGVRYFSTLGEESKSSLPSTASGFTEAKGVNHLSKRMGRIAEGISKTTAHYNDKLSFQAPTLGPYAFLSKHPTQEGNLKSGPQTGNYQHSISNHQLARSKTFQLEKTSVTERTRPAEAQTKSQTSARHQVSDDPKFTGQTFNREERIAVIDKQKCFEKESTEANEKEQIYNAGKPFSEAGTNISNARKGKAESEKGKAFDWDSLRKQAQSNGKRRERSKEAMDSLDYEALRCADVNEISNAIKERGMNNMLAERIKDFLNRLEREHGSIDLEWLRDVPPDKAKDYLLSVRGLGLKSVECVRLLTLHHLAFPVDTNVGRIAVRLGWVPLQPLPESLQLHLLELYPMLETIQKYLWPRLCKLDQRTLYELHYQMITFGKVFCTKSKPNCNACPMRGECRHFASAFASARLALPGPEERSIVGSAAHIATDRNPAVVIKHIALPLAENNTNKEAALIDRKCEPIVEEPTTPEPETEVSESDIEDAFYEDPDEIPMIKLNTEEFILNLHNYMQDNMELQEGDMSKALIALNPEAAAIPTPKLKNVSRLRTEHQVYELPDSHPLLKGLDKREPDDPSPYLLAIWTPGETPSSVQPPESMCKTQESGKLCNDKTCFSCNSTREANSQTVRGTLLIPCRTAMKGSFPLNGTYFQVNEMFADHESSLNPIDVPRTWLWNLSRRTVYFGTSVSTIFKGLSTEGIQYCFWRGFVCVRGFDQKTRAPRPLMARLHFPASKLIRTKNEEKSKAAHDSKRITGLQN